MYQLNIFNNRYYLFYAQLIDLCLSIAAITALGIMCPAIIPIVVGTGMIAACAVAAGGGAFLGGLVGDVSSKGNAIITGFCAILGLAASAISFFMLPIVPVAIVSGVLAAAVTAVSGSYLFKFACQAFRSCFKKPAQEHLAEEQEIGAQPAPANDAQGLVLSSSQRMLASLGERQAEVAESKSSSVSVPTSKHMTNTSLRSSINDTSLEAHEAHEAPKTPVRRFTQ
jgi:hypothetical protein